MLVLTRKPGQTIVIGAGIEITVISASGGKVRLGINAPTDVPVYREEVTGRVSLPGPHARADADGLGAGQSPGEQRAL